MRNFVMEAHGMKGVLANIGAMELPQKAKGLETATNREDADFCALHISELLNEPGSLKSDIQNAFDTKRENYAPIANEEIPPELPSIFGNLTKAFTGMDFEVIVGEINNPAASSGVCCFGKVFVSGFNTVLTAPRLARESVQRVLNPSHTIKKLEVIRKLSHDRHGKPA